MMKEEENLEALFTDLKDCFDTDVPIAGHEERFLAKLNSDEKVIVMQTKKSWWKPLAIAASIALLFTIGTSLFFNNITTIEEQVAEISPEASRTQFYFANLIEEQVKELENETAPKTKKIIDDTMIQLKKLETSHKILEQDLLNGGNSKLIISAMITNFQTRIDLLQEVMNQIENIKKYNGEMSQVTL